MPTTRNFLRIEKISFLKNCRRSMIKFIFGKSRLEFAHAIVSIFEISKYNNFFWEQIFHSGKIPAILLYENQQKIKIDLRSHIPLRIIVEPSSIVAIKNSKCRDTITWNNQRLKTLADEKQSLNFQPHHLPGLFKWISHIIHIIWFREFIIWNIQKRLKNYMIWMSKKINESSII